MIKRKHRINCFFGWRRKENRDFAVRSKMFKQYGYVTFPKSKRSGGLSDNPYNIMLKLKKV